MTEPFDPRDELASAHLDGATTPDEEREVARDPEVQARVEAMRSVRDAVRAAPAPVDDARREQAIAAALSAFDEARPHADSEVTSLAAVAARRSRSQRLRVLGAVAAVALLALLVPALARLGDDGPDTQTALDAEDATRSADTARSTTTAASPFAAEAAPGGGSGGAASADNATGGTGTLLAATVVHLGTFADLDLLADAADEQLRGGPPTVPQGTTSTTEAVPGADECLTRAGEDAAAAGLAVALQATAELDGRPVVVVVVDHPAERILTVTDPTDDCAVVATTTLPR